MNRNDIREMIQTKTLTSSSPRLEGVIVRRFEILQQLDHLLQLQKQNDELEQEIITVNKEIVKAENNASTTSQDAKNLDTLQRDLTEINTRIKKLDGECDDIRQEINSLRDKPAEMERLKSKLEELKTKNYELQLDLAKPEENYQAQLLLYQRLKEFVEKLEEHEERMSKIMNDIWDGLNKDSFDRMYNL